MRGEIYRACLEIVSRASGDGVCTVDEAWHMAPGELFERIRVHERARVRQMKDMDLLAWLVGQYAAVGINSPGRYPGRPDRVRERAVGDDEMRRLMKDMALRGAGRSADEQCD